MVLMFHILIRMPASHGLSGKADLFLVTLLLLAAYLLGASWYDRRRHRPPSSSTTDSPEERWQRGLEAARVANEAAERKRPGRGIARTAGGP